jgi:hypothetical protein
LTPILGNPGWARTDLADRRNIDSHHHGYDHQPNQTRDRALRTVMDQAGILEHFKMKRDTRLLRLERFSQLADATFALFS